MYTHIHSATSESLTVQTEQPEPVPASPSHPLFLLFCCDLAGGGFHPSFICPWLFIIALDTCLYTGWPLTWPSRRHRSPWKTSQLFLGGEIDEDTFRGSVLYWTLLTGGRSYATVCLGLHHWLKCWTIIMQEDPVVGQLRALLTIVEFLSQQSCIRRESGGDVEAVTLQPYSLTERMFSDWRCF